MQTIQLTTDNTAALQNAISKGFRFSVEFGEPESDPTPGLAFFCKDIETARKVYRNNKHTGSLALVQEWNGLSPKSLFEGWVK